MRTDSLFRFVNLRAPVATPEQLTAAPRSPGGGLLSRVASRVASGVPVHEARRILADEFLDSPEYVVRNPRWAPLLATEAWVRGVLTGDPAVVRSALEQMLAVRLGERGDLGAIVSGSRFGDLKQSLWDSYLSAVVRPDRRPQDLPRLLFWIRVWYFLERLAAGEPPQALLIDLGQWRPSLPHQLVRPAPAPGERAQPSEPPTVPMSPARVPAARRARVAQATAELVYLRAAQAQVRRVALARVTAGRGTSVAPGESGSAAPQRVPATQLAAAGVGTADAEGGIEDVEGSPVRDTELDRGVLETLSRLGIDLAAHGVFDLVDHVEARIAQVDRDLAELHTVESVVTVGGALVRRRRRLTDTEIAGGGVT